MQNVSPQHGKYSLHPGWGVAHSLLSWFCLAVFCLEYALWVSSLWSHYHSLFGVCSVSIILVVPLWISVPLCPCPPAPTFSPLPFSLCLFPLRHPSSPVYFSLPLSVPLSIIYLPFPPSLCLFLPHFPLYIFPLYSWTLPYFHSCLYPSLCLSPLPFPSGTRPGGGGRRWVAEERGQLPVLFSLNENLICKSAAQINYIAKWACNNMKSPQPMVDFESAKYSQHSHTSILSLLP